MKFHFTVPDGQTRARIAPLVLTLGREHQVRETAADVILGGDGKADGIDRALADWGYEIRRGEVLPRVDEDEIWLLGVPALNGRFSDTMLEIADEHTGTLLLFQADDDPDMNWSSIPSFLSAWSDKKLRNHWPAHPRPADAGWLPPMMNQEPALAGEELSGRGIGCFFTGRPTHPDRSKIVSELKPMPEFFGSVREASYFPKEQYSEVLSRSKICIAPRGVHQITFRFFEGLSRRCLVLASSLAETRFLHGGLKPDIHYVEITPENVVEKVAYYLSHPDLAQAIANAGFDHYVKYLAPPQGTEFLSDWMIRSVVDSWGLRG